MLFTRTFCVIWVFFCGTLLFQLETFSRFKMVLFNILFSLKAVKISLEIYDNQLSKWENRMLVIKIIKLHEIHPTRANICISPSCILIKHHVSVAIRLGWLWWKWEKSENDWRVFNACKVVLKQLVIICKVMVLPQTFLGCLTSLSRAWAASEKGDPRRKIRFGLQKACSAS